MSLFANTLYAGECPLSGWSEWTACTATCGQRATQTRSRMADVKDGCVVPGVPLEVCYGIVVEKCVLPTYGGWVCAEVWYLCIVIFYTYLDTYMSLLGCRPTSWLLSSIIYVFKCNFWARRCRFTFNNYSPNPPPPTSLKTGFACVRRCAMCGQLRPV